MKVKCINIFNEHIQEFEQESYWLTIGKEYLVISIEVYPNRTDYRIIDNSPNNSPGLHNATQFEIVSHTIPSNWQLISDQSYALFCLSPKAWEEVDFWDACYDNDPKALEIYRREAKIIYESEGLEF